MLMLEEVLKTRALKEISSLQWRNMRLGFNEAGFKNAVKCKKNLHRSTVLGCTKLLSVLCHNVKYGSIQF
jgi:hypothetical protein